MFSILKIDCRPRQKGPARSLRLSRSVWAQSARGPASLCVALAALAAGFSAGRGVHADAGPRPPHGERVGGSYECSGPQESVRRRHPRADAGPRNSGRGVVRNPDRRPAFQHSAPAAPSSVSRSQSLPRGTMFGPARMEMVDSPGSHGDGNRPVGNSRAFRKNRLSAAIGRKLASVCVRRPVR